MRIKHLIKNHILQCKIRNLIKDQYGLLHSTELLLSIILLLFIIATIANLSDNLNEKILSEEEFNTLETIAIESSDYLLNNPGNPENWEEDDGLNNGIVSRNIIPGLAVKKKIIDNGEFYSESESDEILNGSYQSTMAIYPLKSKIGPLVMGNLDDNINDNNIAVVNRTVKCDYYSSFVVYDFNDFELSGDDYDEDEICNHDTNPNLTNHSNDERSLWLCKNFKIYKKSLENYDYYLISDESIKNSNSYWILESLNKTNDDRQSLDQEIIDLNQVFINDLENSSEDIYSIHFNVDKNHINNFKTVLVAIPKNMTNNLISNDELKYDYFNVQDVNFVMKISYD